MIQRALIALLGLAGLGVALTATAQNGTTKNEEDVYRHTELFGQVFERVRKQYVDEKTDKELIEAAINGMLRSLDPHSTFIPASEAEEMRIETDGQFGGLGIEVTMEEGFVKVISPLRDTPAEKAGLKPNDLITHLDGQSVQGMNLSEAVDIMRGLVGTPITLTVFREGMEDTFEVELIRAIIPLRTVRARLEGEGTVGYFHISQFSGTTYDSLKREIEELEAEHGDQIVGYIMDLRNNPGGLLTQAIDISDAFLEKGEIVSTRGREAGDVRRVTATPGDLIGGKPLIVLVNGGSASASEIVAGALKDHRRAVILGTTTFGKGSVQTLYDLPGAGVMKLTTQRYYTPAGTSIQATGIEPDILVEQARIEPLEGQRRQRRESDLRNSLANPQEGEETAPIEDQTNQDEGKGDAGQEGEEQNGQAPSQDEEQEIDPDITDVFAQAEQELVDFQLQRAVDLIKGLAFFK